MPSDVRFRVVFHIGENSIKQCGELAGPVPDEELEFSDAIAEQLALDSLVSQLWFSWARRSINTATAPSMGGHPRRVGYVHFLVTRRRCQRRIVPGVAHDHTLPAGTPITQLSGAGRLLEPHTVPGAGFGRLG